MSATRVSDRGVLFVAQWEGLRLHPYNDAAGNATVGYGHLIHVGHVTPVDEARYEGFGTAGAVALLRSDLDAAAASVRTLVVPSVQLQHRFDALVSFVFNVGRGAFAGSTLLRLLNEGRRGAPAADELLKWDHAGGVELPGLAARRRAERHLYLTGVYGP